MFKKRKKIENTQVQEQEEEVDKPITDEDELFIIFSSSDDFINYKSYHRKNIYWISYYRDLIDGKVLHESILPYLLEAEYSLESFKAKIPIDSTIITSDSKEIESKVMTGHVAIRLDNDLHTCLLINAAAQQGRQVGTPEVEFGVIGAQEAFVEDITVNINLVRKRLPTSKLKTKELDIGTLSKTKISIMYIEDIVDTKRVSELIHRINDIEFDQILDSSYLGQMLYDNSYTIFPLFLNTERPDRVAASLAEGKVTIFVDRSPSILITPTTAIEYFQAIEDYEMPWLQASAFRLLRMFAILFSIFATPAYVAVLTFHYELMPKDLLETVVASRTMIPFSPIIEAFFLEISIELLREAAARLPTKIGQTIGIVGGIVIGQASVAAGLTSNILLIIVALSALASFVPPVYKMGNAIRLLRFPFLIGAQLWGGLGIMVIAIFVLTHLIKLQSVNSPYLEPIYPTRIQDFKDSFIRLPYSLFKKRPENLRTRDNLRHQTKLKKTKKSTNDFYE
nr:spore germination protein [Bacillus massiliigorillae]